MWGAVSDERSGLSFTTAAVASEVILGSEYRGTRDHILLVFCESESYVMTDGQPASLSWNKAPF
jgi:hypothetical protein